MLGPNSKVDWVSTKIDNGFSSTYDVRVHMTTSNFSVLNVGGGYCGLALAQGLREADIAYTLYERDSTEEYHKRPRGWGSLLH